ncbi:MAG: hypothetical protein F4Y44_02415 [Chloroflexi bacterium]|nr:hypothetical protein [Chloroflexota bacterium]
MKGLITYIVDEHTMFTIERDMETDTARISFVAEDGEKRNIMTLQLLIDDAQQMGFAITDVVNQRP